VCTVDAITGGDDDYLERWIMNRLNVAMRHRPRAYAGPYVPGATMGPDVSLISSVMAAKVGKGVAPGLSTLRPLRQDLAAQGMTSKTEPKGYTKDDVVALMGFLGINDGQALQPIWDLFNTTRGKNIKAYQRHIIS
jgi:hypothetical protein